MSHTYLSNGTNATGLVSRLKYTNLFEGHSSLGSGEFALCTFDYTYDANGNIKTVTTDGVLTDSYTYDGLNQLVRHDDASAGKSFVYSYDAGGNITSKKEYAYTTGTLGTVLSEKSYAYDSTWKDKLVSYDGKAITYDEIGNPLTFDGYTFSWQKGRQLASIDGNGVNLDFKYNSDGLRTKKISSDKTIEYYYSGTVLMAQHDGTNWLKFCYSADGEIVGFAYNNTPYYFVKNLQGDIVGIMNSASELVCTYKYDAWGKCTVYDSSGTVNTTSTFIGNVNPIRYRGYYYDAETGFYYASSRYYNPEFSRFLNSDTTDVLTASVGNPGYDKNLFAYCDNNPIIRIDITGYAWETIFDIVSLGVSVVEVCINPADLWMWIGLAGDVVDLIPFITGVGEITRGAKITVRVTGNGTDVVGAAKTIYKNVDVASDIRKSTGSYEILYKSGKNYIGKGGFNRAITSATRNATKYGDEVTSIMWKSALDSEKAFIDEYLMQKRFGGVLSSNKDLLTYNKIWSPGRRYFGV